MDIRAYLEKNGMTQREFGALIGVTQSRVSQWLAGETIEAERAIAIEEKTDGAIRRHELRPDLFDKRPRREAA